MQVTLNQVEIEQAITSFVAGQGIVTAERKTKVKLTAGRKGGLGFTAVVDVNWNGNEHISTVEAEEEDDDDEDEALLALVKDEQIVQDEEDKEVFANFK